MWWSTLSAIMQNVDAKNYLRTCILFTFSTFEKQTTKGAKGQMWSGKNYMGRPLPQNSGMNIIQGTNQTLKASMNGFKWQ